MDGWNTTFLLGRPIFRGYVSLVSGSVYSFLFEVLVDSPRIQGGGFQVNCRDMTDMTDMTLTGFKNLKGRVSTLKVELV